MPSGYSVLEYQGDGVTTVFAVNFTLGYLNKSDIYCRVGEEVDGSGNPSYRTLESIPGDPGRMRVLGAVPTAEQKVLFRRITSKTALQNDFADGEALDDDALDDSFKQTLMIAHELLDGFGLATVYSDMDMTGHTIRGLATDDTDPTSVASIGATVAARDAAVAAQTAAELAQAASESATSIADAHRIAAAASAAAALVSQNAAHASELESTAQAFNAAVSAAEAAGYAEDMQEIIDAGIPDATTTVKGKVQLATTQDTVDGVLTDRSAAPAGVKAHVDARVGTTANKLVQLDVNGKLPAIPGDQLTGLTASQISGLPSGATSNDIYNAIMAFRGFNKASGPIPGAYIHSFQTDELATKTGAAYSSGGKYYTNEAAGTNVVSGSSTGWSSNATTFGSGTVTMGTYNVTAYRTAAELASDFDFAYTQQNTSDGTGSTGATAGFQFGIGTTAPSGVSNSPYASATSGMWYMTHLGVGAGRTITFYNNQTSQGTATVTITAGDVFTFRRRGTALTVLQNGTTIYTYSAFSSTAACYAILGVGVGGTGFVYGNVNWTYNIVAPTNMTLKNSAIAVGSAPSPITLDLIHTPVDSVTLGADIKVRASRDGGSTWSAYATVTTLCAYDATSNLLQAVCDMSTTTSGTSVVYEITTYNTKQQRVQATGLTYAA